MVQSHGQDQHGDLRDGSHARHCPGRLGLGDHVDRGLSRRIGAHGPAGCYYLDVPPPDGVALMGGRIIGYIIND